MTRTRTRTWLACAFALAACSNHADGDDISTATLAVDPPSVELLIENGTPAKQAYTATLEFPDGTTRDVTSDVNFYIDGAYGGFAGSNLTMLSAGKTTVMANLGTDKQGTAEVLARVKDVRVDPSVPANAPDLFDSLPEDAARAPHVVYPAADVIMPRNLGDFEVHWTDTSGNDVFEISLATEFSDVRMYVPGNNGLPAAGSYPSWAAFQTAEWNAAVSQEGAVTYQVRGISSASPVSVGSAPAQTVKLSNEQMEGGLYYWAAGASDGIYGIFRHDMSKPGQPAEQFMTTAQTNGRCVACHVLSRDGTKMAITYDGGGIPGQANGNATLVDVATATLQTEANKWNFGTFTPDASEILTVESGQLSVRRTTDQSVITTMPAAGYVTHPDLSADGQHLVYVRNAGTIGTGADWSFGGGSIYQRTYDQSTHTFGNETPVVTDGNNNYYPSFSPDGQWILFNRTVVNGTNNDAYNDQFAIVLAVRADGTSAPVELTKLNIATGLTNSWARWASFPQSLGPNLTPMMWVTVSSKRDFGVRLVNSVIPKLEDQFPQLWMTPFFPDQATIQMDPSAPAFRLPFQNLNSRNHIAQWTERVVVTQ